MQSKNSREVILNNDIESRTTEIESNASSITLAKIQETIWCKRQISVENLQQYLHANRRHLPETDIDLIQHVSAKIATISPHVSLQKAELKLVFSDPTSKVVVFRSGKKVSNRYLGITKPGQGAAFIIRNKDCYYSFKEFITQFNFLPYVWFVVYTVAICAAIYTMLAVFKKLKLKLHMSGCLSTKVATGLYNPHCAASS